MRHIPSLNGLRALAVALVVSRHAFLLSAGFIGVDIFFVLSGFLITSLLIVEQHETGTVNILHFFARRALRLFPCLWLMIGFVLFWSWLAHPGVKFHQDLYESFFALDYVENWRLIQEGHSGNVFSITWSLAIEEQFYIIWAFLMAVCLPRLSKERLALLIGFFLTIAVAWLIAFSAMDHDWRRVYAGSDTRADELLAGALFAVVYGIPDVAYRIEKYRKLL